MDDGSYERYWCGEVCGGCRKALPQPSLRQSWCPCCRDAGIVLVLLCFGHYDGWHSHYLAADARTSISRRFRHKDLAALEAIIARTLWPEEALEGFHQCVRAWGQGSVWLRLLPEQFQKLTQK